MKKKKKNSNYLYADHTPTEEESRAKSRRTLLNMLILIINCIVFYIVYIFLSRISLTASRIVMWSYMVLITGFFGAYIIYNRAFTMIRKPDEYPEDWSAEKKSRTLEEGKRRREKSKWMLLIIIPLLLTFLIDMLDLFLFDQFRAWLPEL